MRKLYLRSRVEELTDELMHVKIDKAAKGLVINQLARERMDYIEQMKEMSYQLGEARTMLQLQAGKPAEPEVRHVETADETRPEVPKEAPALQPAPAPEPAKGGFFKRLLG